jgi:hypothetical protein
LTATGLRVLGPSGAAGYHAAREACIVGRRQAHSVSGRPAHRSALPLPRLMTIPSDDIAFARHCQRLLKRHGYRQAGQLQARLRRLFPCVVVRERVLSGEPTAWYVYRDGGWRGSSTRPWWLRRRTARLLLSPEGSLRQANPAARSLLGILEGGDAHYTDWVTPGTLEDAQTLFAVVAEGHPLEGTLLVRPVDGHTIACQVRGEQHRHGVVVWLRPAGDVPVPVAAGARPSESHSTPLAHVDGSGDGPSAGRGVRRVATSRLPTQGPPARGARPAADTEIDSHLQPG